MIGRRAVRAYDEMSAVIKEGYDDDTLMDALAKNARRAARVRKEVGQWRRARGMTAATSHVAHHRADAANAEMRRLRDLLAQSEERAEAAEWRLGLAEAENEELLNILEAERARVEDESPEEAAGTSARATEESEWEGIGTEDEAGAATAVEDEYGAESPMGRLAVATARKQRAERSPKSKGKGKGKAH